MMEETEDNLLEEEKKSSDPLEIDDKQLENTRKQKRLQPEPQWIVILRYLILSSIAVGMTLTCPGDTKLWRHNETKTLDLERVSEVMVVYIMTLIAFFWLNGRSVNLNLKRKKKFVVACLIVDLTSYTK